MKVGCETLAPFSYVIIFNKLLVILFCSINTTYYTEHLAYFYKYHHYSVIDDLFSRQFRVQTFVKLYVETVTIFMVGKLHAVAI